jgi:hypothetical protein
MADDDEIELVGISEAELLARINRKLTKATLVKASEQQIAEAWRQKVKPHWWNIINDQGEVITPDVDPERLGHMMGVLALDEFMDMDIPGGLDS